VVLGFTSSKDQIICYPFLKAFPHDAPVNRCIISLSAQSQLQQRFSDRRSGKIEMTLAAKKAN
jgi:hypothetical protein